MSSNGAKPAEYRKPETGMNTLRDRLTQKYAEHYARVNPHSPSSGVPQYIRRHYLKTLQPVLAAVPSGAKIADVGCGTGILTGMIREATGAEVVGVDQSLGQLAIARAAVPGAEFVLADGAQFLSTQHATFDGVFCFDVLEHIPDPDVLLQWCEAAHSSLKPGGFFCCRVPNAANILASYSRYMDLTHERLFTSTSLLQLLDAAGFQAITPLPVKAGWLVGRVRILLEHWGHRLLFLGTGRLGESVFSSNVWMVGWRAR